MHSDRTNDGRKLTSSEKEALRKRAVQQIEGGESPETVADTYGINRRTVYRWLERYHHGGVEGLGTQPKPGRPTKFTADDLRWLSRTIRASDPRQFQLPFALWTRRIVRDLLRRERGVRVSDVTVGRALRKLGLSPQRPLRRAWQQSPEAVDQWKQQVYPEIRRRAQAEGARIYFADEAGMRSDYHAGTTWAPAGETPVVKATGARFGVNMISAVAPSGEMRFRLVEGTVNAGVFADFIERVAADAGERKVFLIVDGHPSHRSRVVQRKLKALDGQVELFFLPPYSPELNPDELVWSHVKRRIGRAAVTDKDDLKQRLISALRSLQKMPSKIMAFFRHPECRYAAA
jgi:transposase